MAALVAGWIYGAQALSEGYEALAYYRGEHLDVHAMVQPISETRAREGAQAAGERWLDAKDAAKKREMPLGVGSLLLGAAMVLFAARSMAGREGARSALVQVVTVHAGIVLAWFAWTGDVTRAYVVFQQELGAGILRGAGNPTVVPMVNALSRAWPSVEVAFRTALSGLIVLALTRPRARAFFGQAAPGPLGEG